MAEVVERLVGHAAGQRAVADHGHDPTVLALQLERGGHAVGVAEDRRRVAVLDPVVLRLGAAGVARQPVLLAQVGELVPAAGHQFVHVGLVAGVPQQEVTRGVEGPVERQGQLDDAEVGAEVAARVGHGVDNELPDLLTEDVELVGGQCPEVRRTVDVFQDHVGSCLRGQATSATGGTRSLVGARGPRGHQ